MVLLEVDACGRDPRSKFGAENHLEMGRVVSFPRVAALFIMKDGDNVAAIGLNVVDVFKGFEKSH